MIEGRSGHTATRLSDGKILVAGSQASAELYDPDTGSWTATASMIDPGVGQTATLLRDGRVLVTGGYGAGWLSSAELYDPDTGAWTLTGTMNQARVGHTATLLNDGTVLVAGSLTEPNATGDSSASAEIYELGTETWTAIGDMHEPRTGHTATLLTDGTVLVVGAGESAELYDPVGRTWTAIQGPSEARIVHTATLLSDGRVLVAGGLGGGGNNGILASAELFDPNSRSWTPTGALLEARSRHTATLLLDGRVLVVGNGPAELYDPVTGSWTATADMAEARYDQTATLLNNGQVLVTGGNGGLSSAELYDPGSGT